MKDEQILIAINEIIQTTTELIHNGAPTSPYETIRSKFTLLLIECKSKKLDSTVGQTLLEWSKFSAFRLVFEAPLQNPMWDKLLDNISRLNEELK